MVLDTDLAAFYGETTKRFNQQVKRNQARFLSDFMFQLSVEEFAALWLQTQTIMAGRGQHRKYLPHAFTKHGDIIGATLLNSPRATTLSVYVVHAFVKLRGMLQANQTLAANVHQLERKVPVHERNTAELVDSMTELLATLPTPPKLPIGFVTPVDKGQNTQAKRNADEAAG